MATGTVKFFNATKGFGFISQSNGGPDVFVHVTAVERAGLPGLVEGQKLNFDIVSERGNVAGMMPHPENHVESIIGSTDGRGLFAGLVAQFGKAA